MSVNREAMGLNPQSWGGRSHTRPLNRPYSATEQHRERRVLFNRLDPNQMSLNRGETDTPPLYSSRLKKMSLYLKLTLYSPRPIQPLNNENAKETSDCDRRTEGKEAKQPQIKHVKLERINVHIRFKDFIL